MFDYLEFTQVEVAKMLGVNKSQVSNVLNDRVPMPAKWAGKLRKNIPDLNTDWLLLGAGEMLKSENFDECKSPTEDEEKELYLLKNIPALLSALGLSAADLALRVGIPEHT